MAKRSPKQVGTAAESAVVLYLRDHGFAQAERRALHGNSDLGDVTGIPGVVVEIKGGDAAKSASDNQVMKWLAEAELERVNASAEVGLLVVQRRQKAPAHWWCVMTGETHVRLMGYELTDTSLAESAWYVRLESAVHLMRRYGFGEPLETEALSA